MRLSAGHAVLLTVTLGTAAGIWLIHDTQRVEREVSLQARGVAFRLYLDVPGQ